ncbi:helix-turn-helix transcriptional regulator [Nocardioides sp. GXZ039]|uniref:helix-turn-helix transcriptional regulator n=1 Tax=Nocardioides sp. GXZ039 TaxID=3136018 RepID=UPI0030F441F8
MATTALQSVPTPLDPAMPSVDEGTLADVYRYAVARGEITDQDDVARCLDLPTACVALVVEQLMHQRLLTPSPESPDRLVPVEPAVAAAIQVSPMEREICDRRGRIALVRQRAARLQAEFESARQVGPGSRDRVERLAGPALVQGHLEVMASACERDVLVVQTGDGDDLDGLLDLCSRSLPDSVEVRIVCQHRSRADLATRARLRALTDLGAKVRTLAQVPHRAIVFDGASAVLFGEGGSAVVLKDDPALVGFTVQVLEQQWDAAVTADLLDVGYAGATDDLRRSLMALMGQGHTDEVVARKLGLSVRTCRRHIASLMQELGAVSRFQAGLLAGRSGAEE